MLTFDKGDAGAVGAGELGWDSAGARDDASANPCAVTADALALCRPRVLGLCRSILRDRASAEDACQEALTRALAALPDFRQGAPIWPWLATITANVCRDMLRSGRPTDSLDDEAVEAPSASGPEEAARLRTRATLVQEALADMPAKYRATLYLREIEGWSYAEIAEVGNSSLPAVRTSLMRGRRVLAARLERMARQRREWPLAGLGVTGGWMRRVRARAAQLQAAVETGIVAPLQAAGVLPNAGWFPFTIGSTVASAAVATAAVAGLGILPASAQDSPPAVTVRAETVVPRDEAAPRAGGESSGGAQERAAQPAVVVGKPETRTDGDARVATAPVAVEAGGPAPDATDGQQVSDGPLYVGPVALSCGDPDRRREVMSTVCRTLRS